MIRYIENNNFVDEFEMEEIESNIDLNKSLRRAQKDMKLKKGKFVE